MISVCMAVFNGEKYIREQIESILPQLSLEDEIVIVDDNSSDKTLKILESIEDQRIIIIKNVKNIGVILSFELSISQSRGEVIFLSDQDDIWLPNKVKRTMNEFNNKNVSLVISDAYMMRENIISIETFYNLRNSGAGAIKNIITNSYIGCCMAFRKNLKNKILPFPENIPMHDVWIGIISDIYGKSKFINDRLIIYRRHNNNVSSLKRFPVHKIITNRVRILNSLLIRYLQIKNKEKYENIYYNSYL